MSQKDRRDYRLSINTSPSHGIARVQERWHPAGMREPCEPNPTNTAPGATYTDASTTSGNVGAEPS